MFSVFQERFRPVPAQAGEMEPFCLQCPKDSVQSSQARCCDHSQSTSHKSITVLKLSCLGRIDMLTAVQQLPDCWPEFQAWSVGEPHLDLPIP